MRETNFTKQKILIIGLGGVFILAVVMLGVMFFGGKNKKDVVKKDDKNNSKIVQDTTNQNGMVNNQGGQVKQGGQVGQNGGGNIKNEKLVKLVVGDIRGLTVKPGTNLAMFYKEQKILTADPFTGKLNSLGAYPFVKIKKMLWNKKADKAIINDTGDYYIYNLNNNLTNKFRDTIDTAIWDKTGEKIIYKYYNSKSHKRKIRIADINGENSQLIVSNIPYRKIDLLLQPVSDKVCYYPMPDARVKGKLFCSNVNGQDKKEYGGEFGQDYLWSPNGQKLLTSYTKGEAGNQLILAVMNKDGGEMKALSFATTVKKCVWSKDSVNVFCAMVTGAPLDVMLPNGWDDQTFNSVDSFWKINTRTGEKTRLLDLEKIPGVIDSESLVLDSEESFLYFRGRRDGSLWRIKL